MAKQSRAYELTQLELPHRVSLKILFGSHVAAEDLGGVSQLRRQIGKCDILVPEVMGWMPMHFDSMTRLTKGERYVYQQIKKFPERYTSFDLGLTEALFNQHVPLLFVDIPGNHPAFQEYRKVDLNLLQGQPPFREACRRMRYIMGKTAVMLVARDEYMLTNLASSIEDLANRNTKLRKKRQAGYLSVLMFLGASHRFIYDALNQRQYQLKEAGVNPEFEVSQEFAGGYKPGLSNQIVTTLAAGEEVSDLLIAQRLLESLLLTQQMISRSEPPTTAEVLTNLQGELEGLTLDELQEMYQRLTGWK